MHGSLEIATRRGGDGGHSGELDQSGHADVSCFDDWRYNTDGVGFRAAGRARELRGIRMGHSM